MYNFSGQPEEDVKPEDTIVNDPDPDVDEDEDEEADVEDEDELPEDSK